MSKVAPVDGTLKGGTNISECITTHFMTLKWHYILSVHWEKFKPFNDLFKEV